MEYIVKEGYFLAPKSYALITEDNKEIIKHKGPAKGVVNIDWFMSQFTDPSRTEKISLNSKFRIDWHTLNIAQMDFQFNLKTKIDTKRDPVYKDNVWVDTQPKDVIDFGGLETTILKCIQDEYALLKKNEQENAQRIASLESEIAKLREDIK